MATENSNDWVGNLINAFIFNIIGAIFLAFNWLFNILSMHSFWYDTMSGFAETMYAPDATSWDVVFN